MLFCHLLIFLFSSSFFPKIITEIEFEWQAVWIYIRPNILSGMIWVQTVCRGYHQATKVVLETQFFNKNLWEIQSECWKVWIHIRPTVCWAWSGSNWFQRLSAGDKSHLQASESFSFIHLNIFMLGEFYAFLSSADFYFKTIFLKKFFLEYNQIFKQFWSRSGLTFYRTWSWSKLHVYAKFISRPQMVSMSLAGHYLVPLCEVLSTYLRHVLC